MIARKRSKEEKKAKSLRVQEIVHRLLYCETYEADLYHAQFVKSAKRAKIDLAEIDEEIVRQIDKEFHRRIERKASGQESFGRDLIFYHLLESCMVGKLEDEIIVSIDQPEECIYHNLALLVRIGLLSKTGDRYATTPKGRKIYRQLNTL